MPFDSSGTFTRLRGNDSWSADATSADKRIKSDIHDTNDNDLANGLSECITRTGKTQVSADIAMGGHKLVNLGDPTQPQDSVTLQYLQAMPGWPASKALSGTDSAGRLNFTGLTGANGISWSNADMAWLGLPAVASKYNQRVVMTNTAAATTAATTGAGNIFSIDESGRVGSIMGQFTQNLAWDGALWRTPSPGYGTMVSFAGGSLSAWSNDAASVTDPYLTVTLRQYFEAINSGGSSLLRLTKSASGKANYIQTQCDTERRWTMYIGDTTVEAGGAGNYTGSNFRLLAADNAGAVDRDYLTIDRGTRKATFFGDVTVPGVLTTAGQLNFDSILQSSDTSCILAAASGGTINLRPNGSGSTAGATNVGTDGELSVGGGISIIPHTTKGIHGGFGYWEKAGSSASSYGTQVFNFLYNTSADIRCYVGTSFVGTFTPACDYRIKKDIEPLGSSWAVVKALRPVSYTDAAFGTEGLFVDRDIPRWGFLAHELQEALLPSAASGEKDGEDLQQPNLMAVIAALTRALQEAMLRIEALETGA